MIMPLKNSLNTAMVSWLPLPANSAEAAADASFRTVTCRDQKRAQQDVRVRSWCVRDSEVGRR